jgi:integrase
VHVRQALLAYRDRRLSNQRRGEATYRSLSLFLEPVADEELDALSTEILANLIERMAANAPVHARRVRAYAAPFLAWARGQGLIIADPLSPLAGPRPEARRDRRLDLEEIRSVWLAAGKLGYPFGAAIGVLLLTAAYRDEVGALRVSELTRPGPSDWVWRPRFRSISQNVPEIPLPTAAARLIEESLERRPPGSDFVFTTTGVTAISGWSRAKRRLDRLIARRRSPELLPAPWRLNDLRSSFAALAANVLAIDSLVIERCLGRVSGYANPVAKEWAHSEAMRGEHRLALERWAELVTAN